MSTQHSVATFIAQSIVLAQPKSIRDIGTATDSTGYTDVLITMADGTRWSLTPVEVMDFGDHHLSAGDQPQGETPT